MTAFARRHDRVMVGALAVLCVVAFWELSGRNGWVNPLFTSYPSQVLREGIELMSSPRFPEHARASFLEFAYGFVLGILVGLPLGLILGRFRRLNLIFEPLIMALYVTPRLALLPIIIVWLGIGLYSKVAVVFLGAVFPILINVLTGIKLVDPLWLRAARSYGASELDLFTKVMLPGSLPYIFLGVRLGLGRALLGVIVAEMYVSTVGIGHLIMQAGEIMRTGRLMFLAILVSLLGTALTLGLRSVEGHVIRWGRASDRG